MWKENINLKIVEKNEFAYFTVVEIVGYTGLNLHISICTVEKIIVLIYVCVWFYTILAVLCLYVC